MRYFRLFFLLILGTMPLQAVKYSLIHYSNPDGLPQSVVTALLQDAQGYLWVGTQVGLARFDGRRFEVFTTREGLSSNQVNALAPGPQGSVWAALDEGLANLHDNGVAVVRLPARQVRDIAYDAPRRCLWALTESGVFSVRGDRWQPFPDLAGGDYRRILVGGEGALYLLGDNSLLIYNNGLKHTIDAPMKLQTMAEYRRLLLVGTDSGLFFVTTDRRLAPYLTMPAGCESVTAILADAAEDLWIGSTRGVYFHCAADLEQSLVIDEDAGLANNSVQCLLADRENNMFIGTMRGLAQVPAHLFAMYDRTDGLPSSEVWSIVEDGERILLACNGGLAEMVGGRVSLLPVSRQLRNQSVRVVLKMAERRYLLGCREKLLLEWDGAEKLQPLPFRANILHGVLDQAGRVWLGTDDGLLRYDGREFTRFREGLVDPYIWALAVLPDNRLLAGTRRGLQIFDNGVFRAYPPAARIGPVLVNDIWVASPQEIFVASETHGLFQLLGGRLRQYTRSEGLQNNDVWSVRKDRRGAIWLNTSRALTEISERGVSHFNRGSGLFGDEGGIHAALEAADGRLLFSVSPGIVVYNPRLRRLGAAPPPTVFVERITSSDKRKEIEYLRPGHLQLPHRRNNLVFHIRTVTLNREQTIFFRTRLQPYEDTWSAPSREPDVRYTNLPPGHYLFEVQISGGSGKWRSAAAGVFVTITSPLWQRWWFLSLSIVIGVAAFFAIMNLRVRRLQRTRRELEKLVLERTVELDRKNRELARLSVTDPLTGLKNRRYFSEKIKDEIHFIRRNRFHTQTTSVAPGALDEYLGIFMLDIDFFKSTNDIYGHKAGDCVLVQLAQILVRLMRQSDTVVRWGGEEFLVMTRLKDTKSTMILAEKIRRAVAEHEFRLEEGVGIRRTVSIGFAHFPFFADEAGETGWEQVVSLADTALYIAKHNGRNKVVGLFAGEQHWAGDTRDLFGDIRRALNEGVLTVSAVGGERLRIPNLDDKRHECLDPSAFLN